MTARMLVISCEHASNAVPDGVELGIDADVLATHVAWDHGAAPIATALADHLGIAPFLGEWTRLVVDLNRFEHGATAIPVNAFGTPVPGNLGVTDRERERRFSTIHRPYRRAVGDAVATAIAAHGRCVHLSIHSFTPRLHDSVRDFDMGILFDPDRDLDRRVSNAMIAGLNAAGLDCRANAPYTGTGDGLTTALRRVHGENLYAGIEVETSHRVTEAPGGIARVAAALIALTPLLTQL
jgi:predicted N-formylglutamate amidohydrolase